jgi:hypothetical protein
MLAYFKTYAHSVGAGDRSLALFRLLLGLYLLWLWGTRFAMIPDFFVSDQLIPKQFLESSLSFAWAAVKLGLFQTTFGTQIFFAFGLFAHILLLLGFLTRLATILSLFFIFTIIQLAWATNNGSDQILANLLFYSCFLPLGSKWSIDSLIFKKPVREVPFARFFIVAQLAMAYFFAGTAKSGADWIEGIGLYYAWSLREFGSPLSNALVQTLPLIVIKIANWSTVIIELAVGILILVPLKWLFARRLAILLGTGLMFGIAVTMRIDGFPILMIIATIGLLADDNFWDTMLSKFKNLNLDNLTDRAILHPIFTYILLFFFVFQLILAIGLNTNQNGELTKIFEDFYKQKFFIVGQDWRLFAPNPSRSLDWYSFAVTTRLGVIDPYTQKPPALITPPTKTAPNLYWQRYYERLGVPEFSGHMNSFVRYTCRRFGFDREPITLYRIRLAVSPPGQLQDKPLAVPLYRSTCAHPLVNERAP